MRNWLYRSKEINYLLNPAYCGKIIYSVIKKYNDESDNKFFPFSLVYLILPIMLNSNIEEVSFPRIRFSKLITDNPELFINFQKRAKDLVAITNETIEFLLSGKALIFNEDATLECNNSIIKSSEKIIKQSEKLGKLFALAGSENIIYLMLGVRP